MLHVTQGETQGIQVLVKSSQYVPESGKQVILTSHCSVVLFNHLSGSQEVQFTALSQDLQVPKHDEEQGGTVVASKNPSLHVSHDVAFLKKMNMLK